MIITFMKSIENKIDLLPVEYSKIPGNFEIENKKNNSKMLHFEDILLDRGKMLGTKLRISFDSDMAIGIKLDENKVTKIMDGSQAAISGVNIGWRIISVNGQIPLHEKSCNFMIKQMMKKENKIIIVFAPPPGEQFWR